MLLTVAIVMSLSTKDNVCAVQSSFASNAFIALVPNSIASGPRFGSTEVYTGKGFQPNVTPKRMYPL